MASWIGKYLVGRVKREAGNAVYKFIKEQVTYPTWSRERKEKDWDYHQSKWYGWGNIAGNPYRSKTVYGPKTAKQAHYRAPTRGQKFKMPRRSRKRSYRSMARRPRRKTYRKFRKGRPRRKFRKRTTYAQPRRMHTSGIRIWTNQSGGQSLSVVNSCGSMQMSCGNTARLNALMDLAHPSPTDVSNMFVKKGYLSRTLHNAGTNKIVVTVYPCRPRRRLNATGDPSAIFISAATQYYGSDVTLQPTCVPGDLPHFTQRFNLGRAKTFVLAPNASKTVSLRCGPFWYNEGDFDTDTFSMDRRASAFLIRFHGQIAQDITDDALSGYSIARINWIQNEKYYFHSGVQETVTGTVNDNYPALVAGELPGKGTDVVVPIDFVG